MEAQRDLLAEWMELGREVLRRHYPEAVHAVFVIEIGPGIPATQLVITPHGVGESCSPIPECFAVPVPQPL